MIKQSLTTSKGILLWLFLPISMLLLVACSKDHDDPGPEPTPSGQSFTLTVVSPVMESVILAPSEDGAQVNTRFRSHFTEDATKHVFAKQNGKIIDIGSFYVTKLSDSGDEGKVEVDTKNMLSAGKPYTLYLVGDYCRSDDENVYFKRPLSRGGSFGTYLKLSSSSIPQKANDLISGTGEILFIINKSGAPIKFKHKGFDAAEKWYYNYAEVSIDNLKVVQSEDGETESEVRNVPVFTGTNASSIYSTYVPNGHKIQDAQLIAEIDGKEVRSTNRISSDIQLQMNHSYAMFAIWDGEKLTLGDENGEPVVKIELPEGTELSIEKLTILGDGEEIDVNEDGTFSSSPASLIALNDKDEIVYLSYGNSNDERVLGPVETALALLLATVPNVVTDFDSNHLRAFKVMVALLKPTYDLVQAIKESIVKYNCLNIDVIQPHLTAAVRELHHRCGLDKESLYSRKESLSPRRANEAGDRPAYPYFKAVNSRTIYHDFITVQMTDAQLKEKDGANYWACMFDVYNDNRFVYTSFTKALKTADGFKRYDDSWADTFRYLIKPYNLSEFMDLGLVADLAYDPEHFLTTLVDYDYSNILEDPLIARFWEPFAKDHITTYDKTVKRDIGIDFFTANEHLWIVGPGMDDNLLLFNLIKIGIQPLLKIYVKLESSSEDLDKFTMEFLEWVAKADLNFRADLLQYLKDPNYSMWEKITYAWDKLSERIEKFVMDKLYDAASEVFIKRLFGTSGSLALKGYKKIMNALKTGYIAADIFEFFLDSQYMGYIIEIEQGYGDTNGTIPNVPGSDF